MIINWQKHFNLFVLILFLNSSFPLVFLTKKEQIIWKVLKPIGIHKYWTFSFEKNQIIAEIVKKLEKKLAKAYMKLQ